MVLGMVNVVIWAGVTQVCTLIFVLFTVCVKTFSKCQATTSVFKKKLKIGACTCTKSLWKETQTGEVNSLGK